jgi:hypothetical protein
MKTYTNQQVRRLTVKSFTAISQKTNSNIVISAYLSENALTAMRNTDNSINHCKKTSIKGGRSVDEIIQTGENEYQVKMRE